MTWLETFLFVTSFLGLMLAIYAHYQILDLTERVESLKRAEKLRNQKETTGVWPVRKHEKP